MPVKAILLNTQDFTDRPKDPPPVEAVLQEMKEYCKRNNYDVITEITSQQKYMYGKDTPLSKLILAYAKTDDEIAIVKFGRNYEQVAGETIDGDLTRLVSKKRLRTEPIEHPCVSPPKDGNTRIWRYLNLPKFVDLLQTPVTGKGGTFSLTHSFKNSTPRALIFLFPSPAAAADEAPYAEISPGQRIF